MFIPLKRRFFQGLSDVLKIRIGLRKGCRRLLGYIRNCDEDSKLLTAKTAQTPQLIKAVPDNINNMLDRFITALVAVGIVHFLEQINITYGDCNGVIRLSGSNCSVKLLVPGSAIKTAGQGIMLSQPGYPCHGGFTLEQVDVSL